LDNTEGIIVRVTHTLYEVLKPFKILLGLEVGQMCFVSTFVMAVLCSLEIVIGFQEQEALSFVGNEVLLAHWKMYSCHGYSKAYTIKRLCAQNYSEL